jgi:hypothetical protein
MYEWAPVSSLTTWKLSGILKATSWLKIGEIASALVALWRWVVVCGVAAAAVTETLVPTTSVSHAMRPIIVIP